MHVLCAYFDETGLGAAYCTTKVDPNTVFDMGRVHQIYLEMQRSGTLVSLEDVQAMLGRIRASGQ